MFQEETAVYSVSDESASTDLLDELGYSGSNEYAVDEGAEYDAAETDDAITALELAYGAALADETDDTLDSAPMVQDESAVGVEDILYTTAQMGDLPSTEVLDQHVGDFHGRPVRRVQCSAEDFQAQRKAYMSQGKLARTEVEWQIATAKIGTDYRATQPAATSTVPESRGLQTLIAGDCNVALSGEWQEPSRLGVADLDRAPVADLDRAPVADLDRAPVAQEPEIPQAIREAEALAHAAQEAQAAYKARQEQRRLEDEADKRQAEEVKRLLAAAAAAKAAAPVLITPELRVKLDIFDSLVGKGEQAVAKAILNGVITIPLRASAKADTGTIRTVAAKANSTGVVDIHHHGTGDTIVNASNNVVTEERRALVLDIKARIAALPAGIVADTQIAKAVGLEPRKGSKLVYNIRVGAAYAHVS